MTVLTAPDVPLDIGLRYGEPADRDALASMFTRCSEESRHRRFHTPLPVVPARLVDQTLSPEDGWSVVAEVADRVVGVACVGPLSTADLEVGILVEDAAQGHGIGTRLLLEVAREAAWRGYRTLLCLTQPDNEPVLRSIARSGLPAATSHTDGLMAVTMHLQDAGPPGPPDPLGVAAP
jgi:GNAT superfamily N-acetyltransferase